VEISPAKRMMAIIGCILGNMVDGYGVVAVGFIGRAIEKVWQLSPATLGLVFASGPAGMMLGSLFISPLADRFGRRRIALSSLLLVCIGMLAASYAHDVSRLIAMLVITGMGIGGILATLNTAVAEIAPPEKFHRVMASFSAGYPLGSTIAGGFAIGLMMHYGWPVVFQLGAGLAGVVFLFNFVTLPESTVPSKHLADGPSRFTQLFGAGNQRKTTIAICLAFFLNMISFYFILLWTARLTISLGFGESAGASAMTIVNIGSLVGPLIFGLLADRLGLIRIATLYFVCLGTVLAAFGFAPASVGVVYALAAAVGVVMSGAMTSLYVSTPLLFGPEVRAAGTGLAIGIGRAGATLGPLLAGIGLQAGLGRMGLYFVFAVPPLLVVLLLKSGFINPPARLKIKGE
jgi:MFS family permease